jgi:sugar/nucleoside kinase (ribokinase family)
MNSNPKTTDVFGVGNALVDILAQVDDDFVCEHALVKGTMTLMDAEKQGGLLTHLEHHSLQLRSGGSAANTMIALARCGGSGFYSGKVARDSHGEFYRQDLMNSGIHFDIHPSPENGAPTGTCLVLTTPDAERTMCTHLGVSTTLSPEDIHVERLERCQYCYMEGYLWDAPGPRHACLEVLHQAQRLGVRTAFTFSDPFLVDRFASELHDLVREHLDLVFCNAAEARRFCQMDSLQDCAETMGALAETVFITDGAQGCLVVHQERIDRVPGFPVTAVDLNGAGDAFAGGVLYGLTHGMTANQAARWGNYVASQIVQVVGARLAKSLEGKVAQVIR